MKKISIITLLILSALYMQSCKKSDTDTTTTVSPLYQAYINNVIWTPTTVTAAITYTRATNTKTFTCTAVGPTDKVTWNISTPATSYNGIAIQQFNLDTTGTTTTNTAMQYYSLIRNSFGPVGTPRAGYINISGVDTVLNVITGTFAFNVAKANYDNNGNVISITNTAVTAGEFTSMPFTYTKK